MHVKLKFNLSFRSNNLFALFFALVLLFVLQLIFPGLFLSPITSEQAGDERSQIPEFETVTFDVSPQELDVAHNRFCLFLDGPRHRGDIAQDLDDIDEDDDHADSHHDERNGRHKKENICVNKRIHATIIPARPRIAKQRPPEQAVLFF